ncbi:hypothetical protein HA399_14390 [Cobetia sp. UIB-001]|uniref:VCBS domain-containing protein n=1 Tax=Cobetia sp. UIB-001 TaxID=2717697 RepID=UPI00384B4330
MVEGTYGTLTLNSDGSYSYVLDTTSPAVQSLNNGETEEDTFTYVITDADGDSDTATLTITVEGPPTASRPSPISAVMRRTTVSPKPPATPSPAASRSPPLPASIPSP